MELNQQQKDALGRDLGALLQAYAPAQSGGGGWEEVPEEGFTWTGYLGDFGSSAFGILANLSGAGGTILDWVDGVEPDGTEKNLRTLGRDGFNYIESIFEQVSEKLGDDRPKVTQDQVLKGFEDGDFMPAVLFVRDSFPNAAAYLASAFIGAGIPLLISESERTLEERMSNLGKGTGEATALDVGASILSAVVNVWAERIPILKAGKGLPDKGKMRVAAEALLRDLGWESAGGATEEILTKIGTDAELTSKGVGLAAFFEALGGLGVSPVAMGGQLSRRNAQIKAREQLESVRENIISDLEAERANTTGRFKKIQLTNKIRNVKKHKTLASLLKDYPEYDPTVELGDDPSVLEDQAPEDDAREDPSAQEDAAPTTEAEATAKAAERADQGRVEPTLPGPQGRPRRTITISKENAEAFLEQEGIDPNNPPEWLSVEDDGRLTITIAERTAEESVVEEIARIDAEIDSLMSQGKTGGIFSDLLSRPERDAKVRELQARKAELQKTLQTGEGQRDAEGRVVTPVTEGPADIDVPTWGVEGEPTLEPEGPEILPRADAESTDRVDAALAEEERAAAQAKETGPLFGKIRAERLRQARERADRAQAAEDERPGKATEEDLKLTEISRIDEELAALESQGVIPNKYITDSTGELVLEGPTEVERQAKIRELQARKSELQSELQTDKRSEEPVIETELGPSNITTGDVELDNRVEEARDRRRAAQARAQGLPEPRVTADERLDRFEQARDARRKEQLDEERAEQEDRRKQAEADEKARAAFDERQAARNKLEAEEQADSFILQFYNQRGTVTPGEIKTRGAAIADEIKREFGPEARRAFVDRLDENINNLKAEWAEEAAAEREAKAAGKPAPTKAAPTQADATPPAPETELTLEEFQAEYERIKAEEGEQAAADYFAREAQRVATAAEAAPDDAGETEAGPATPPPGPETAAPEGAPAAPKKKKKSKKKAKKKAAKKEPDLGTAQDAAAAVDADKKEETPTRRERNRPPRWRTKKDQSVQADLDGYPAVISKVETTSVDKDGNEKVDSHYEATYKTEKVVHDKTKQPVQWSDIATAQQWLENKFASKKVKEALAKARRKAAWTQDSDTRWSKMIDGSSAVVTKEGDDFKVSYKGFDHPKKSFKTVEGAQRFLDNTYPKKRTRVKAGDVDAPKRRPTRVFDNPDPLPKAPEFTGQIKTEVDEGGNPVVWSYINGEPFKKHSNKDAARRYLKGATPDKIAKVYEQLAKREQIDEGKAARAAKAAVSAGKKDAKAQARIKREAAKQAPQARQPKPLSPFNFSWSEWVAPKKTSAASKPNVEIKGNYELSKAEDSEGYDISVTYPGREGEIVLFSVPNIDQAQIIADSIRAESPLFLEFLTEQAKNKNIDLIAVRDETAKEFGARNAALEKEIARLEGKQKTSGELATLNDLKKQRKALKQEAVRVAMPKSSTEALNEWIDLLEDRGVLEASGMDALDQVQETRAAEAEDAQGIDAQAAAYDDLKKKVTTNKVSNGEYELTTEDGVRYKASKTEAGEWKVYISKVEDPDYYDDHNWEWDVTLPTLKEATAYVQEKDSEREPIGTLPEYQELLAEKLSVPSKKKFFDMGKRGNLRAATGVNLPGEPQAGSGIVFAERPELTILERGRINGFTEEDIATLYLHNYQAINILDFNGNKDWGGSSRRQFGLEDLGPPKNKADLDARIDRAYKKYIEDFENAKDPITERTPREQLPTDEEIATRTGAAKGLSDQEIEAYQQYKVKRAEMDAAGEGVPTLVETLEETEEESVDERADLIGQIKEDYIVLRDLVEAEETDVVAEILNNTPKKGGMSLSDLRELAKAIASQEDSFQFKSHKTKKKFAAQILEWATEEAVAEDIPSIEDESDFIVTDEDLGWYDIKESRSKSPAKGFDSPLQASNALLSQMNSIWGKKATRRMMETGFIKILTLAEVRNLSNRYKKISTETNAFVDETDAKIIFISDNIANNTNDARGLILHEIGVHYGKRIFSGREFDQILDQLYKLNRDGDEVVQEAVNQVILNYTKNRKYPPVIGPPAVKKSDGTYVRHEKNSVLWEEVLAHVIQFKAADIKPTLWDRITKAFVNFFKKITKPFDTNAEPEVDVNDITSLIQYAVGKVPSEALRDPDNDKLRQRYSSKKKYEFLKDSLVKDKVWHASPFAWTAPVIEKTEIGLQVGTLEAAAVAAVKSGAPEPVPYAGYIKIKNPLELPDIGKWNIPVAWKNSIESQDLLFHDGLDGPLGERILNIITDWTDTKKVLKIYGKEQEVGRTTFASEIRKAILDAGYDSIKYTNMYEDVFSTGYILLEDGQFKNATSLGFREGQPAISESRGRRITKEVVENTQWAEKGRSSLLSGFKMIQKYIEPKMTLEGYRLLEKQSMLMKGKKEEAHNFGRIMHDVLANVKGKKEKDALTKFFETRGASPDALPNRKIEYAPFESVLRGTKPGPKNQSKMTIREAAVKAKDQIERLGQDAVDAGVLKEEQYEELKGQYLPRVYLKYVQSGQDRLGTGYMAGSMGYTRARKDEESFIEDLVSGRIKDPAYLASRYISMVGSDLATINYLNYIASDPANVGWVLPNQVVEIDGVSGTTVYFKNLSGEIRQRAAILREGGQIDDAKKQEAFANKIDKVIAKYPEIKNADTRKYKRIPKSVRYGGMQGLWVDKIIWDDITQQGAISSQNEVLNSILHLFTRVQKAFKYTHVPMQVPAQARNAISNTIFLNASGVPIWRIPSVLNNAMDNIVNNGKYMQIARKYGIEQTTFASEELGQIDKEFAKATKDIAGMQTWSKLKIFMDKANVFGRLYQKTEVLFKIAKIIDLMENNGYNEVDAAMEANEALLDYSNVSPLIRTLRSMPLGSPFITFNAKALTQMIRNVKKHPIATGKYLALPFVMAEVLMSQFDELDEEDVEALKAFLPEYAENNGNVFFLPYKDDNGKWVAFDMSYFLPWGAHFSVARDLANLEIGEAVKTIGVLGGPVQGLISGAQNVDPFTGQPIWNENDTPHQQAQDIMMFMASYMIPPMLMPRNKAGDIASGGGPLWKTMYAYDIIEGNIGKDGFTKYGELDAWLSWFGINTIKIGDYEMQNKAYWTQIKLTNIMKRAMKVMSDPNLTEEKRQELYDEYNKFATQTYLEIMEWSEKAQALA